MRFITRDSDCVEAVNLPEIYMVSIPEEYTFGIKYVRNTIPPLPHHHQNNALGQVCLFCFKQLECIFSLADKFGIHQS